MRPRFLIAAIAVAIAGMHAPATAISPVTERPVFGMGTVLTLGSGIFSDRTAPTILDADLCLRCVVLDEESAALARSIIAQVDAATREAQAEFETLLPDMESETDMVEMPMPLAQQPQGVISRYRSALMPQPR